MFIPHKLSYPPTPVLCQLTGLPSRESETAAELANCWLLLLATPFRSPASRAKAVRFSRPAERPRSVNMRSESLGTLVPPRFSARPATTAPPMLRMQEQARHHRGRRESSGSSATAHLAFLPSTSGATATGCGSTRTGCGPRRRSAARKSRDDRRPGSFNAFWAELRSLRSLRPTQDAWRRSTGARPESPAPKPVASETRPQASS